MCGSPTKASASVRRRRRESYLNIPSIVSACEITGADAVHPGYGFLSENARFADILAAHDIAFIGPSARPHPHDGRQDQAPRRRRSGSASPSCRARAAPCTTMARRRGSPARSAIRYIVKAAAGGGGRGMKVARTARRSSARALHGARGGAQSFRRRRRLSRKVSRPSASHRDPGARRRAGRGDPSRRARLLAAAPASENLGGGAARRR